MCKMCVKRPPFYVQCLCAMIFYVLMSPGYVVYKAGFFTGGPASIDHSFQVRTDFTSGLLFFVHGGPGSYYLVQFVAGGVYWEVSTGDWRGAVIYPNNTEVTLCDGRWHSVRLVKIGAELNIQVHSLSLHHSCSVNR